MVVGVQVVCYAGCFDNINRAQLASAATRESNSNNDI